jgi:hypothetical protein
MTEVMRSGHEAEFNLFRGNLNALRSIFEVFASPWNKTTTGKKKKCRDRRFRYYRLVLYYTKHNKPRFDDECSKLIDQRKQAKLQWLQNSSQISGDNLQNLRSETSRIFRNKKREYLKDKINELETNNKNKNI